MSLTKNQKKDDWSVDAAAVTKFCSYETSKERIIPYFAAKSLATNKRNTSLLYQLTYNEDTQKLVLLKKIDMGDDEIVDIIDPKDVIGVDLQIEFPDSALEQQRTIIEDDPTSLENKYEDDSPQKMKYNSTSTSSQQQMSTMGEVKTNNEAMASLNIYSYPKRPPWSITNLITDCFSQSDSAPTSASSSKDDYRTPYHIRLQLVPCEDFSNIQLLVRAIRTKSKIENTTIRDCQPFKKYLIVMNPFSGSGNAKMIYDTILSPMLEQCGNIKQDFLITTHAGHAQEHCQQQRTKPLSKSSDDNKIVTATTTATADISEYDAIIALGGDGILFEILQGLQTRADYETLMEKIKFGIVGCGTCNGLAKSILHSSQENYSVLESTFMICSGLCEKMDLSSYQTTNSNKTFTSFLTFSWAIMADIDIEGERLRWLGPYRCEIWAAVRAIFLRSYKARFSYLPYNKNTSQPENDVSLLSLKDPIPSNWITMEDDFVFFWASHVSHAGVKLHSSPHSKLNDGIFQIMVVRKPCSRYESVAILLALEDGTHVNHPKVEFIACKAYRLEPITPGSFNDLDGEVIESGPIQAHVQPGAIQMFNQTCS